MRPAGHARTDAFRRYMGYRFQPTAEGVTTQGNVNAAHHQQSTLGVLPATRTSCQQSYARVGLTKVHSSMRSSGANSWADPVSPLTPFHVSGQHTYLTLRASLHKSFDSLPIFSQFSVRQGV